jgi:hypothetical protein
MRRLLKGEVIFKLKQFQLKRTNSRNSFDE